MDLCKLCKHSVLKAERLRQADRRQEVGPFAFTLPIRFPRLEHVLTLALRLGQVVFAALIALGSRRSNHSSIVGVDEGRLVGSDNRELLRAVDLGLKREAVCGGLADRAVDLARKCKLLQDISPEAVEAASVLRVALFGSSSSHLSANSSLMSFL